MASAKSSSNKPESFKDFVIKNGYLGFIQGDNPNEWYPLINVQYEFIGKMPEARMFFFSAEGYPDKYTGTMSNPNNDTIKYDYEVIPLIEDPRYFINKRLLLTNKKTGMTRIVVFTKDLFPHDGATQQKGGSRIKCKTTHKKRKAYKQN